MKYLVTLADKTNEENLNKIADTGGHIEYISDLLPLAVVQHSNIDRIRKFDFVYDIKPDRRGKLEKVINLEIRPQFDVRNIRPHFEYKNIRVAVIDSGIDSNLNIVDSINLTNFKDNNEKHGSLVANIINQFTPRIKMFDCKITDSMEVEESKAIIAAEWAYRKGANIINMSMGFDTNRCKGTCNICLLIEELKDKNVLTITAAGNEGPYLGSVKCPGNSSAALTVGAINLNSKIADFSSRGRYGQNKPDVLAPGYIYIKGSKEPPIGGTSFSTPIVTGLAAGIFTKFNACDKVKEVILNSTVKLGYKQHEEGNGLISADRLLEVLRFEKVVS